MNQLLNSSSMVVRMVMVSSPSYFLVPLADFHCIISSPTFNVLETICPSYIWLLSAIIRVGLEELGAFRNNH